MLTIKVLGPGCPNCQKVEQIAKKAVATLSAAATCGCGSGVPVLRLMITGKNVEVVALPLLFEQFHREGKSPDQLMDSVKIYNAVPPDLEAAYGEAVRQAFGDYCSRQKGEA